MSVGRSVGRSVGLSVINLFLSPFLVLRPLIHVFIRNFYLFIFGQWPQRGYMVTLCPYAHDTLIAELNHLMSLLCACNVF